MATYYKKHADTLCGSNAVISAFVQLRQLTLSFVMYVCTYVCMYDLPYGTPRLPMDGFSWNFVWEFFKNL